MLDILLVSIFVLGSLLYLAVLVAKKIRALRDSKSAAGCACGTQCDAKRSLLRGRSQSRSPDRVTNNSRKPETGEQ